MSDFLLGDAEESGREVTLHFNTNRLVAVKWHQWKVHLFEQEHLTSTWSPLNVPLIVNLDWDPREERNIWFPHAWVLQPVAAAAGVFLKSLVAEPPIKPGTPDPYTPPKPGTYKPETHVQIGPIVQVRHRARRGARRAPGSQPRNRAQDGMNEAQQPTRLCVLLVCFAGAKTAAHVRHELGKRVRSSGGAPLDETFGLFCRRCLRPLGGARDIGTASEKIRPAAVTRQLRDPRLGRRRHFSENDHRPVEPRRAEPDRALQPRGARSLARGLGIR